MTAPVRWPTDRQQLGLVVLAVVFAAYVLLRVAT